MANQPKLARGPSNVGPRSAWCWGSNKYGKLGDGTDIDRYRPTLVIP